MTKEEVKGNIQYNENLVCSYQNNVRQLEAQIRELEELRRKFQKLQTDLDNKQSSRKRNLSNILSKKVNLNMVNVYTTSMNELLTGLEYANTYGGLSQAQEEINSRISVIQREVNELSDNIAYRKDRIVYWRNQLPYAAD